MRAVALVAHHQPFFEHELHQLQRGGISTVLTQCFMHLAHGAGAVTPQHRQDGYFGVGWKRRGSGLFGMGSGGHAPSIIRIDSYVNEIIRMTVEPDSGRKKLGDFPPARYRNSTKLSPLSNRYIIDSHERR